MSDLISRQDAIDAIERHIRTAEEPYYLTETDRVLNYAFEVAASCVCNLPSAESTGAMDEAIQQYIKDGWMQIPDRPKGECNWCANLENRHLRIEYYWIDGDGNTASFTGKDTHVVAAGIARFCPNCGADMRGDAECVNSATT